MSSTVDEVFPRLVPAGLFCGFLAIACLGCNPPLQAVPESEASSPELVVHPTLLKLPAKLTSELATSQGQPEITCTFPFKNTFSESREVVLGGTGCSCYGVYFEGRKLGIGEKLMLSPGQSVEFQIRAHVPLADTHKDFQAYFVETINAQEHKSPLQCGLHIYADITVDPPMQAFHLKPEAGEATTSMTVRRCIRASSAHSPPPTIENLPASTEVVSIENDSPPEEIESGLWRQSWKAKLRTKLTTATDVDSPPVKARVVFPSDNPGTPSVQEFLVVSRIDLPIHFPRVVHFGKVIRGQSRTRTVFCTSMEREFEISPPAPPADPSPVNIQLLDTGGARKHSFEVTITPQNTGDFQQHVTLKTNLVDMPEIQFKVQALVTEP